MYCLSWQFSAKVLTAGYAVQNHLAYMLWASHPPVIRLLQPGWVVSGWVDYTPCDKGYPGMDYR